MASKKNEKTNFLKLEYTKFLKQILKPLKMNYPPKFSTFAGIMVFYAILTYVVFPYIYFLYVENTLKGAGIGFILGSVVSVLLWISFGSNMV